MVWMHPYRVQGQCLASGRPRIPLNFAREALHQVLLLKPDEFCSVAAQVLFLPPGTRDDMRATARLAVPTGLSVQRYEYTAISSDSTKTEYRMHGFRSCHPACRRLCDDGWYLVGKCAAPNSSSGWQRLEGHTCTKPLETLAAHAAICRSVTHSSY